ncbi:MAG: glycoside hydrolase family 20 zincin-like fold domain-containing protein [Paramuribaculum sp.]|nr:glycoside hydrolase family 20 zincin-like fold domain-containing protein [Paramuribaculum sp.]
MTRHLLIALLATLNAAASFGAKPLSIIPAPTAMELTSDKPVSLKLPLAISIGEVDSLSREMIEREVESISPLLMQNPQEGAEITFCTNTLQPIEGYRLTINEGGIKMEASSAAGFFYGLQTLKRLMGTEIVAGAQSGCTSLPPVTITDAPRFAIADSCLM